LGLILSGSLMPTRSAPITTMARRP